MEKYKIKKGADISHLNVEMREALPIMASIYAKYGYLMTITSGNDGRHMKTSKHYTNDAVDLRIWGLEDAGFLKIIANELQIALDNFTQGFQVVIERDHYHVEFDPKNWKPQRRFKL